MGPSHYPGFDMLSEQEAWDDYSREIVLGRLRPAKFKTLRQDEIDALRAVVANLLFEARPDILDFVVAHIDSQLTSQVGESERKSSLPPQDVLVRHGIAALHAAADEMEGRAFQHCKPETQFHILQTLQKGKASLPGEYAKTRQKDLFKKLLLLAVDAFASHPTIWTEMGFPGPAYPRGYYRVERRRRDPWEAVALPLPEQGGKNNGSA